MLWIACIWRQFSNIYANLLSSSEPTVGSNLKTAGNGWNTFAHVVDSFGWPHAILVIALLIVWKIDRIGAAFRRIAIIRKISISGIELHLDRAELDDIKEKTDKTFIELINKTNVELKRLASATSLPSALSCAADGIINALNCSNKKLKDGRCRFTLHVEDPVFSGHLVQTTEYYLPQNKAMEANGRSAGRRFSKRYGIIGLASRSGESCGVANAFAGKEDEIKYLQERWSMDQAEANRAKTKPSCIAVILRGPTYKDSLGVLYADAETPAFFGADDKASEDFAKAMSENLEVKALASAIAKFATLVSQFELKFDLTETK